MIRELCKEDLTEDYLKLLTQLSGTFDENKNYYMPIIRFWTWYEGQNVTYKIFVYENEGVVEGTATVFIEKKLLHGGSSVGHIEDVVVNNKKRLKGVGKALIERCVEYAKQQNCYKVILDCADHNITFYESCGFSVSCRCMRVDL